MKNKCFRIYGVRKGCESMEENKLAIQSELTNEDIKNLIYTIRGKQVMLDSDVAMLYHYPTKRINETVNRNKQRFPENFCFQLTDEEYEALRCKNVTLNQDTIQENIDNSLRSQFATLNENIGRGKHRKYLPYAFTEQGIAMLSGLLKNDIAIQVSINIMNAFVEMRKFLMINGQVFERLTNVEYQLQEHNKKFDEVFNQLQLEENIKQRIFLDGQIYDAYSIIVDIIKRANSKILIIDNYIDDSVLKMLAKKKNYVEVVILTSDKSNIENLDVKKFNKEYPILKVAKTNKFHDRFIVIDNKEMYHLGASIKDLGKKCFAINRIEDIEIIETHHNRKIDSPSGTALMLANTINEALGGDYVCEYDRHSKHEKRGKKEIGMTSIRGGNIVGEHTVKFFGEFETFEITHTSYSRNVFAEGAIKAAEFIVQKPRGLYNMDDLVTEN